MAAPSQVSTTVATDFHVTAEDREPRSPRARGRSCLATRTNPTGAVFDRPELEAIAALADEHDLLVFCDEIYDRLVYGDRGHGVQRAAGHARAHGAPGRFQQELRDDRLAPRLPGCSGRAMGGLAKIHQYAIMSAPTSAQFAALEALRIGEPHL